jgi:hypothetical protein
MCGAGKMRGYAYIVECSDKVSVYGIDGGRIINLFIGKNGTELYFFDKKLFFDKLDIGGKEIFAGLIKKYN